MNEENNKRDTIVGACCCFSAAILTGITAIFLGALILHGISALVRMF